MRPRRRPRIGLPRTPLRDGPTGLRPWRDDDAAALVILCRDPDIVRFIDVPGDYGDADARAYLQEVGDGLRSGRAAGFAVTADADPTAVGAISLLRIDWPTRRAEVGYWLGAPARGRGHATRAVGLLCGWAFRELGVERIALLAAADNPASQAVALRSGFTREVRLRAWEDGPGGREDVVGFGRLAGDPG